MKSLTKSLLNSCALLVAAGAFSGLSAAPFLSPMDGVDVYLNGTASASYNSNVLSAPGGPNKKDDYIMTFAPGLEVEWGHNSVTDVVFNYTESFERYLDNPALNSELSNVSLTVNREGAKLNLSGGVSYVQNYNNTPSSAGLGLTSIIRSDTYNVNGNAMYSLSDKFNFNVGAAFTQVDYLYTVGQNFQNADTYSIPASLYYVYSPELSFGLGYTYDQTDPKSAANGSSAGRWREDNAFTLNAQLTKFDKLTGSANVGVTSNYIAPGGGQSSQTTTTLSYGVDIDYALSDKVTFTLNGNRGFSTGSQGQNVENTGAGLSAGYSYSDSISFSANVISYTYSQYLQTSRNDNTYSTGISANWRPKPYLTLSAGYTYFMNSSNAPGATYNINTVTISASVHY